MDVIRKVVNGQPKIEYANPRKQVDSDGFTLIGKKNKNYKANHRTTGSAISDIRSLRAISKPYHYYVGQWCMKTSPEILKNYISKFARVIDVVELSTHIEKRYFRAFKVSVESFCAEAMLTSSNWPGGIQVERWYRRTKKVMRKKT